MGEVSQSGQLRGAQGTHPDADQLSAFLEQALPAHEREEVLAHLAVCRGCRETVALALPPAEEFEQVAVAAAFIAHDVSEVAAPPAAAPARRRRLARWTIWTSAAAALAALALSLAFLHRAPRRALPEQAQMAAPQSPAQPEEQPATPAAGAPPSQRAHASRPGPAARAKNLPPVPGLPGMAGRGRALLSAGPLAQAAPPENGGRRMKMSQPMGGAPGVALGSAAAPSASAAGTAQVAAQTQAGRSLGLLSQPLTPPPATTPTVHAARALTPQIPATSAVANESVAPLEIHGAVPESAIMPRPLPSRQAVLADEWNGSRVVAIDARHTLFFSTDAGQHWTRVHAPWQGQAMHVRLVPGGRNSGAALASASNGNPGGFADLQQIPANAPGGTLTGTVTDTSGAVIPGAAVTVTGGAAANKRTVKADGNGRYVVQGLAPGNYDLDAAAPGFAAAHLGGIAVDGSRPAVANLQLPIGMTNQAVTVEAASSAVKGSERANRKKAAAAPVDEMQPLAVFEVTTDSGERWTSADGKTWKQE